MFEFARIGCELKSSHDIISHYIITWCSNLRGSLPNWKVHMTLYHYMMFEFTRVGCKLKSSHNIISHHDVQSCMNRLRTQEFTWHYITIWCSNFHESVANLRVHMTLYQYMMIEFARVGCELKSSHDIISLHDV